MFLSRDFPAPNFGMRPVNLTEGFCGCPQLPRYILEYPSTLQSLRCIHGVQLFLNTWWLLSLSNKFPNMGANYFVHKNSPLTTILCQLNPVDTLIHYFIKMHFNIISSHLHLSLPSDFLSKEFPNKISHHQEMCQISRHQTVLFSRVSDRCNCHGILCYVTVKVNIHIL
jgi:hypothetical protein